MLPRTLAVLAFTLPALAWNFPPHRQITSAALATLPDSLRRVFAGAEPELIQDYCLFPDRYQGASGPARAAMRPFCETPEGILIHNITWNRADDLAALEYLLNSLIRSAGDPGRAARFAGVLAHFLEDSTCPAHASNPAYPDFHLYPELHRIIESSTPAVDLAKRAPQLQGNDVAEAARNLLDRVYAAARANFEKLGETVHAVTAEDQEKLDRIRHEAALEGARLVADAYYSALIPCKK